jgi:hypothetical protein
MAMKKGQFRLAGTTVSEQISVAYLFETGTNKTLRVNKGAAVNGITVESVSANRVVLKQGDETEELFLRTSNSPKPPPPPPPVAAAPGQPGGQAPGQAPGQPAGSPNVAQAAPPPGFTPPGVNVQPGYPPGAAMSAPPLPTGMSAGGPPVPGAQNPNTNNPNDPAATPAGVDPNNPAARRRRFQNLPQ